ncbi:MAG: glutamine-hydrolyzing GMP synthase subunit GuaA, partial [Clostridia bacterium]|nr:glutamine-hydrolyzing GMP synthase subunit GuaA [Clostridia bacterium]
PEHLSYELIEKLVNRITSEVKGVNRVLFDFTPQPPATSEWE